MIRQQLPEALRVQPKIGDVYMVQFEGSGSVQRGFRPGVIFSNNVCNRNSPNVIVLPLTTSIKKVFQPTHVILFAEESGLRYTSMVLCENPQCISKANLTRFITHLSDGDCARIAEGFLSSTASLSFLDFERLIVAWENSVRTNAS